MLHNIDNIIYITEKTCSIEMILPNLGNFVKLGNKKLGKLVKLVKLGRIKIETNYYYRLS